MFQFQVECKLLLLRRDENPYTEILGIVMCICIERIWVEKKYDAGINTEYEMIDTIIK